MDNRPPHYQDQSPQNSLFELAQLFNSAKDNFDQIIADNTTTLIDLPSSNNYNSERFEIETAGTVDSATEFTDAEAEFQLSVNGNSGDRFTIRSRETTSYVPNYEMLWGSAFYMQNQLEQGQVLKLEFLDTNRENGYVMEITNNTRRAYLLKNGVEKGVREFGHDDNYDPYNNGLDETTPQTMRTFISWYGAGPAKYTLHSVQDDGTSDNDTVAQVANRDSVATNEINLRMGVTLECTEDTTANTVNVLSMGAVIRGDGSQTNRVKDAELFDAGGDIDTSPTPIIAIRRRADYESVPTALTSLAGAPTDDMKLFASAIPEENVTASEWDIPAQQDPENTAVEQTSTISSVPIDADGNVEGRQLSGLFAYPGGGNRRSRTKSEVLDRFYEGEIVVIFGQTRSATGASIDLEYSVREDW